MGQTKLVKAAMKQIKKFEDRCQKNAEIDESIVTNTYHVETGLRQIRSDLKRLKKSESKSVREMEQIKRALQQMIKTKTSLEDESGSEKSECSDTISFKNFDESSWKTPAKRSEDSRSGQLEEGISKRLKVSETDGLIKEVENKLEF